MSSILQYLQVFLVGGITCVIAQVLINTTKMTTARILVIFLLLGVFLQTIGVYKYILEWGHAGASTPINGFGAALAKGTIDGTKKDGLVSAIAGGLESVAEGLAAVIFVSFIIGLFAKAKTK